MANVVESPVIKCKKCGSERHVKAGFRKGEQRYRCKDCGCKFVPTLVWRRRTENQKIIALFLYVSGLSLRRIAVVVKADLHAVYRWIRDYARTHYEKPKPCGEAVVVELDEMWGYLHQKKNKSWMWKAYCRDTKQLIDWECGGRDNATFMRLYERLKRWNVKCFFSDRWQAYSDVIPSDILVQSKRETHLIESNNMPQRHWFARFRRKTVCVSRSLEMIDLTLMLYAKFHVNGKFDLEFTIA